MPFKNTGTLLLKLDGEIAFASTYFCDLIGVKHDRVAGMSCFDFVFPEDMDAAPDLFAWMKFPLADPLRFRLRRLDGTEVWTNIQSVPLKTGETGRIYAITATITAADGDSLN